MEKSPLLPDLHVVGIMTGNSMDAVDVVLTRFSADNRMEDLAFHSLPYSPQMYLDLFALRQAVQAADGNMDQVAKTFTTEQGDTFATVHNAYLTLVAQAVNELLAHNSHVRADLIGCHGQTLAHCPPSVAQGRTSRQTYTVQIGDGHDLAQRTGIPVVYDFRSDDMMNGGEGAPLAPRHQEVLARQIDKTSFAFCNGGNTGNVTIVGADGQTLGWDTGPFNYFPDQLIRRERQMPFDAGGKIAQQGKVNLDLLQHLFDHAVITDTGDNFLLAPPPKSMDGQWYRLLPELTAQSTLRFEDRLRTADYFAAYTFFHSLSHRPAGMPMPRHFLLYGGGWKNNVIRHHFEKLLSGDETVSPLLPAHRQALIALRQDMSGEATSDWSSRFGFEAAAMEARIFAHAAVSFLKSAPFTDPATTGCTTPTVCGVLAMPPAAPPTPSLEQWIKYYNIKALKDGQRWSRAHGGTRIANAEIAVSSPRRRSF